MEKITCVEANKLDLVEYLSTLGHKPVKIQNNDFWYRSPLRQEKTASFKVNRMLNLWFDHGSGEGGTFVDFGIRYHRCSIQELLKLLSSYNPGIAFSFQAPSTTPAIAGEKKKPTHETIIVLRSRPLENKSLLLYLHQRSIDPDFTKGFCREIDFCLYGRERTAIGFPNRSGGFELRSVDFKGSSSPKDISLLLNAPTSKQINVLEGFTDFLSLLSMEPGKVPGNFLVLNSLSFAGKSLDVLKAYDAINLYLDQDTAGRKATAEIMKALPHAIDHSFFYRRYKDLNEYLAGRKGGREETASLKKDNMEKGPDNGESTAEEQRQKRQNHSEAKAIVAEVVHRLSHPDLSKRSIGIVTFSSVQQILIDDLLTEVFASRPDLEKIALESEEPIFIKNLENVQGDERDVILFSVGYGPDNDGKVSLNFGPINRDGGWRRLNVAVSRARYEMKVFSTLRADQIDLNRTNSEGVAGLKAFLAYAEKGKIALPVKHSDKHETITSFESVIADEIRKHGYEVHTHIGCSAYKIDIGVVDPEDASQYLLAILTDGKSYYNATTSKDREIVQVDVLKQLGWNVYKIWSTEWWEQPDKTIKGILEAIDVTKRNKLAQPIEMTAPAMQEEQVQVPEVAEEKMLPDPATQQPEMLLSHSEPTIQSTARPAINTVAIPYVVAQLEPVITASAEEFLLAQNKDKIKAQVLSVLETESPISKNLLCKRVLQSWNISRLGTRINNHFDLLFSQIKMNITQYGDKTYFWKINQYAKSYSIFRVPSNDAYKRDADDLPPEEIANVIKEILHNQISLSQSDLIRETAKIFGYARIGVNVEIAILAGIEYGISRAMAYRENDRIVLR